METFDELTAAEAEALEDLILAEDDERDWRISQAAERRLQTWAAAHRRGGLRRDHPRHRPPRCGVHRAWVVGWRGWRHDLI